jgi:hypothetical protein
LNKKIGYGLAIIIVIALYIIYSGFVSPFEIREYPITVSVNMQGRHCQLTLYENGTGFYETPYGDYYGEWEIQQKKGWEIEYMFVHYNMDRYGREQFILYPDHTGTWEPGPWGGNFRAHWDYTRFVK